MDPARVVYPSEAARGPLSPLAAVFLTASFLLGSAVAEEPAREEPEPEAQAPSAPIVEKIVVTATRADEGAPATFSNLSLRQIDDEYWAQDVPALLRITPSVYSYSDSGNDIGYSYLRIRGFDQRRIAVTINGVPLNDAESHEVFWVDLPNLADSTQDIQVQRGVGTSLYGAGAIGGSVNLETARLTPGRRWFAESGLGSFGTSKLTAGWTSDALGDGWVLSARLSRIATDGYREQSWTRMAMAFLSAQRTTQRSSWRINLYGGREDSHLAYEGITREQLAEDRRQNPLDWPGEQDHFTQPHLELIHEWLPRERLEVGNTVYSFYGRGYFDQFREDKDLFELHLADEPYVAEATNVFRERWVKEWDVGWIPRLSWKHARGKLTAGAELRLHRGRHFGTVRADDLPPGTPEGFRYYDYQIPKNSYVFYAQEEWRASERLTLLGGLQRVVHIWELREDRVTGYGYDQTYSWWAPRLAAGLRFGGDWSGFASVSRARREPAVKDLYDPQDAYDAPAFRRINEASGRLEDPIPEEEKLTDYEAGLRFEGRRLQARLTRFEMQFEDEIVYLGALNDLGQAITGNAERSVHRGFEMEATARLGQSWSLAAQLTLSHDEYERFLTLDWDPEAGEFVEVDYSGHRIAGFPDRLARISLVWRPRWGRLELGGFHSGRIYLDNAELRERSIDPYESLHLDARYDLPWGRDAAYALRLRVDNLLDEEYEAFGYVAWGTPLFIPAADRRFFAMLSYRPPAR